MAMLAEANVNVDFFAHRRDTSQGYMSVYAMRMAAVFTLFVSTVGLPDLGPAALDLIPRYLIALVLLVAAGEQQWTQLMFPSWVCW
jgi:hypothetical protein